MNKKMLSIGSRIEFGEFHGKLSWTILDICDGKVLLISDNIIDCKKYNVESGRTNWGKSSIRAWLNGDFIKESFTEEEVDKIIPTLIKAEWNPDYKVSPGEDTTDRVFLFSINDARKYLKDANLRMCSATKYAKDQGAFVFDNGKSFWWLRTPGDDKDYAVLVHHDGYVNYGGFQVKSSIGIRPSMWVKID